MQAFGMVDILNKLSDVVLCLLKRLILLQGDFLALQRFEKAFGFSIVIGIAQSFHADLRLNATLSSDMETQFYCSGGSV
jgi:hypothetical protein